MARTMRYRRKRGMTRRRGVTRKTGRRRLTSTITPTLHRRGRRSGGPFYPGTVGLVQKKRRAGQKTPMNIRSRKRLRFGEPDKERTGGFFTGQLDKYKFQLGRKRSIFAHLRKLDKKSASFSIERFGATQRFTAQRGAFDLFMKNQPGIGHNLPMYLLELDTTSWSSASGSPASCFWQAWINGTDDINWWPTEGVRNDGTTTGHGVNVLKTNISATGFGGANNENYITEWSSVKFLFRCPQGRPGYVKVWLVQFPEVKMEPQYSASDDRTALFQKLLKEHIYNPIAHETTALSRRYHNGMKVLKTWTKNFNPDSKENYADYNGQQIRLDLFLRHNRFVNRHLRAGQTTTFPKLDDDAYRTELETAQPTVSDRPADPRARLFLLVTGTHYDESAVPSGEGDGFDKLKHITFDMEFRGKRIWGGAASNS